MVLLYLVRGIRKAFAKPEDPDSQRSDLAALRLRTRFSPSSMKLGRWTVLEDNPKEEDPFAKKN